MADLGSAFQNLTTSWFRLETLQAYDVEEEHESFAEFLRTGRLDSPGDVKWREMISGHVDAGRSLQRVHVIEEPLTDYVRYEIAEYVRNREAGEDIRLLPVPAGDWPEGLPQGTDFWLLDDGQSSQSAWAMAYDNEGRFLGVEEVQDPDLIDTYRRWRDTALGLSVPLNDYRRQDA
ncbi:hypothetical protein OH802_28980 [Nocardioides sp. NBC_00850]|uniref:DUF6879 family protein n=1 Tax=Nocardioides sp. NBC_00850 TaxID=2976001 RepID=UPI0038639F19|nr:hypothetical protein OH802_28980 [Nocardioides sp. NBC_00850]